MARLEFLQSEYLTHAGAANSTWGGLGDLWGILTDYWKLHKDRKTIDVAWNAAQTMVDNVADYSRAIDGIWGAERMALTSQKASIPPTQLFFGTEEYFTDSDGSSTRSEFYDSIPEGAILCKPVVGTPDKYYLPTWVRDVASLRDFILEPTLNLASTDFTIATSVLDNETGTIEFIADYKDVMWCQFFLQKSISDIITPWGLSVGYDCRKEDRLEEWAYRDVKALSYALMNGPTVYNLELGLSVFNLWPYSPFKSQVTSITGTTSITLKSTEYPYDEVTVSNSNGLPFRQRTEDGWVDIAETDIIEGNRALTEACHVETWNSDPQLFINLGFSDISGRHVIIAVFDAGLPLAAAWSGWINNASYIAPVDPIPALSGYAIDQARTLAHTERAKNSGTSFYFIALLDVQLDILDVPTSYGIMMDPVDGTPYTSYDEVRIPDMEIDTTFALTPGILASEADTTYHILTVPENLDIDTSYAVTLAAPSGAMGETSY